MPRPTTRAQLLDRIDVEFDRLMAEVDRLPPKDRLTPGACGEWSVKDILAHLDAWHELLLEWEHAGSAGRAPAMPAPGFRWKDMPELNDAIWKRTRAAPLAEVTSRLRASHQRVRAIVEAYDDEGLFARGRQRWTGSTSVGSYAVSATSSHYAWAADLVRRFRTGAALAEEPG
jgi:hypothetical protein